MKLLFVFFSIVCCCFASYVSTVTSIQPDHLLQYLPMNETSGTNAYDSSGNGRNAVYVNCVVNRDTGIVSGEKSVRLNGTSSWIGIYPTTINTIMDRDEGSIMLWFYSKASPWGGSGSGGVKIMARITYNSDNFIQLAITNTNLVIDHVSKGVYQSSSTPIADISAAGTSNAWMCIVLTWSTPKNETNIFINGSQVVKTRAYSGWDTGDLDAAYTRLGQMNSAYFFNGYLSHWAMWDTSLTRVQVDSLAIVKTPSVLMLGNSITAGQGATSSSESYVYELAIKRLKTPFYINSGIAGTFLQNTPILAYSGSQPGNGRDRVIDSVVSYHPKSAYILYGINDMRYNNDTINVTNYTNDLRECVTILQDSGIDTITIGTLPVIATYTSASPWDGGSISKHQIYNDSIRQVALYYNLKFAGVYDSMVAYGGSDLVSVDNIHPNDSGHSVIATAFYNACKMSNSPVTIDSIGISQFALYHTGTVDSVYVDGVLATSEEAGTDSVLVTPASPMMWRSTAYPIMLYSSGDSTTYSYKLMKSLPSTAQSTYLAKPSYNNSTYRTSTFK